MTRVTLADLIAAELVAVDAPAAIAAAADALGYKQAAESAAGQAADISGIAVDDDIVEVLIKPGVTGAKTKAALAAAIATALQGGPWQHTGFSWCEKGAAAPDSYAAINAAGADVAVLAGNTGYARQRTGVAAVHAVQSRMRRCVVKDDGSGVVYYLDADDSTKIAGSWDGSSQTGWVRVYEGALDPVKTTPGQAGSPDLALRAGVGTYAADVTYDRGARVLHGGSLWDSLADGQIGVTPAAGTSPADLTGGDGQVMVEIPAFYYAQDYDPTRRRHSYEVVFDPATYKPFPDLTVEADLPDALGRFKLHPTFTKAGKKRAARYRSAFHATATDSGNNGTGLLQSVADGSEVNLVNVSNTNFRIKARNRNIGLTDLSGQADDMWSLYDYWLHHALQLLFFTEYRTFYSQAVVGGGNISGSDFTKVCGRSAPMGNSTGVYNDSGAAQTPSAGGDFSGMTWRGIEDWWGTAWQWMDGWNIRNAADATEHFACQSPKDYAYSTTSGYTLIATTPVGADAWQYANALAEGAFLPSSIGGSTTTYLTDSYYANALTDNSWRVPRVGAAADNGANAGAAALAASSGAGNAGVNVGASLIL